MAEPEKAEQPASPPVEGGVSTLGAPVSIGAAMVIAALFAIASGALSVMASRYLVEPEPPRILVVDSNAIVTAKLQEITSTPGIDEAAAAEAGRKFAKRLNDVTREIGDMGYVVVNSAVVLAGPDSLEVTKDVASRLGVKLDK